MRLASATDGTTVRTLMPLSLSAVMYLAGLPAPVVTMETPSSSTISTISSMCGVRSMRFTPNGLSVSALALRISVRRMSVGM